nr:MAG TPA: SH3-like domain protein [Caudoviricetes sp.]
MTHEFKFGDRVKRKSDGAVGIVVRISFKSVLVFFDGAAVSSFYDADDFEIVPHPDTVRLDWLAENDCALTKKLCDEDGDIHPTPNAVIKKQEDHFEVLVATSNDIREAIDVAMAHIESKR